MSGIKQKWLAVDLDGTLAEYLGWAGEHTIGYVIPAIAERLKERHAEGWKIAIFTANLDCNQTEYADVSAKIWGWLSENDLAKYVTEVTAVKRKYFTEFWDDRAITVEKNKGVFTEERLCKQLEIEKAEVKRLQGLLYAKNTQNATAIDKLQHGKDAQCVPSVHSVSETACSPACSLDVQIGGSHYKDMVIQPAEYCEYNNIPVLEAGVIKYVSRHTSKNGVQDLQKAKDLIDMIIEMRYEPTGLNHLAARINSKRNNQFGKK